MKKYLLFTIALALLVFGNCYGQALTIDQKAAIAVSPVFQARVQQVMKEKAQFWSGAAASTRADVNLQFQKRKRLAKQIFTADGYAEARAVMVGNYWLTTYTTSSPALDVNGIPTATAINDNFDPTYDYFSGYKVGDEDIIDIDW